MDSLELNIFNWVDFNNNNTRKYSKINRNKIKLLTRTTLDFYIKNKNTDLKLKLKPKSILNLCIYILNYFLLLHYINVYLIFISFNNSFNHIKYFIYFTEIFTKIIFLFDFILNILKLKIYNNNIIISKSLKKYYKYKIKYFIFDVLNWIPFQFIFFILNYNYYFNISVFIIYLKLYYFFDKEKWKIIKNILFKNYLNDPIINKIYYTMLILIFYISIFINWRQIITKTNNNSYNNQNENSPFVNFIIIFYWVIQTIFTVGYGDIPSNTKWEILVSILWMLFGVFIYSLLISNIVSIYDRNFYENYFKAKYLKNLIHIKYRYKIKKSLEKEVKNYIVQKD